MSAAPASTVTTEAGERWRREFRQGPGNVFPGNGRQRWSEGRIAELERKVGQQALEIDFLKGCLQRIEEQRMLQALTGNPRSTGRSRRNEGRPVRWAKCLPAAVARAGCSGEGLRQIQACRWPGLVCTTTQGSCPLVRMSVGAHAVHGCRVGTIQIDQNIAGVLVSGVSLDVHVATLAVAHAQKSDGCGTHQPSGINWSAVQSRSPGNGLPVWL